MAFCSNCGRELPEGIKFCPNCGTAVINIPSENSENEYSVYQKRPDPSNTTRIMEISNEKGQDGSVSGIDKYGKFYGIALLILAIICFFSDPPLLTLLLAAVIIAGAIFCLCRKYRLKGFSIAALVIATICVIASSAQAKKFGLLKNPTDADFRGDSYVREEPEEDNEVEEKQEKNEVDLASKSDEGGPRSEPFVKRKNTDDSTSDTSDTIEESSVEDSETGKTEEESSDGVDPDLKAFLDSYEEFMDEYIDFMQKYMANPTDLTLLGEYADMMQKCADFEEKVDKYDTKEMSTADAAYYLEVTNRVTQKMLKIYSN